MKKGRNLKEVVESKGEIKGDWNFVELGLEWIFWGDKVGRNFLGVCSLKLVKKKCVMVFY